MPLPAGEATAVVTFDSDRVSPQDVKRWMQVSEQGLYLEPHIQFYSDCKSSNMEARKRRLQADISGTHRIVRRLDPVTFPAELSRVILYLRQRQSFWLWQAEQQLAFMERGDKPGLEWGGINAEQKCGNSVKQFRAQDPEASCRMVFYDWHNCTLKAIQDRLGPYAKEQWQAFLDAHHLRVKLLSTIGD